MKYIPYVLIVAIALIVFTGFVVDEGGRIQTSQEALTIAQGAARAGTNAAGGTAVNGDAFELSGQTAIQAAQNYIASAGDGVTGTATIDNNQVVVHVTETYKTKLSYIVGITQLKAVGVASARLIDG